MSTQDECLLYSLRPRRKGTPFARWLYEETRAAILEGRISAGSKLPSRTHLARQYGVSVGTVVKAFDPLRRDGYVDCRVGRGTYVRALPDAIHEQSAPPPRTAECRPKRVLSSGGRLLVARPLPKLSSTHSVETFRLDRLALDAFPTETWNHLAASRLSGGAAGLLSHGEPLGFPPLRAAIAEYIRDTRGIRCNAEQVVITSGTQQSLDLVARLLLERGDPVWVEDPGYVAAASVLRAHGAEVIGVPVDAQGIDCDAGRQRCPFARLAYVTPVCQFPLGVPISAERRLRLLQWADDAGAWIFEDDHDPQLQLEDQPPAPLFNQDRASSVIYSCSFNRILFSSLRLGFLILPPSLVGPAATALSITQRYHPVLEQAVLADFMEQGHLQVHVRQMREIYRARREALLESGRAELGDLMQFNHSQAFLQTIGWLASGMSEAHVWQCAAARNIDSIPLSNLTIERRMPPALVLGIGGADAAAIRLAMKRLSRALRLLAWRPKRFEASPSIGARST